ncbi:hypothetical protein N7G274_002523 [Stereocaulon virgatum]|uniref:Fungal N-terminal domain-containing protein n=1 Tax=Stereocaulon virgatum TaxID=373712 RepID=A0ABR4AI24_9LECA
MAMAGVGEVSAIVNLIAIAATLSQAIIDVSCRYKHAGKQIESFGREVGLFGQILDQFRKLPAEAKQIDTSVKVLIDEIVTECSVMLSQLDAFNKGLHGNSKPPEPQNISRRGKAKWLFEKTELEYLRARVDSMKINILLMMALQSSHDRKSSGVEDTLRDHAESITKLSLQSDVCAKRLQTLENEGAHVEEDTRDNISTSMSMATVDTAASARSNSTLESIYRAYGWKPHQTEPSAVTNHKYDTKTSADPGFDLEYLESCSRRNPYSDALIQDLGRKNWDQHSQFGGTGIRWWSDITGSDTPKAAALALDLESGDDMLQKLGRLENGSADQPPWNPLNSRRNSTTTIPALSHSQ